jgi:hypothetical protein
VRPECSFNPSSKNRFVYDRYVVGCVADAVGAGEHIVIMVYGRGKRRGVPWRGAILVAT